jgi:hypothetical protein
LKKPAGALTEAEASGKKRWIIAVPTPAAHPSGPWWAAGVFMRGDLGPGKRQAGSALID